MEGHSAGSQGSWLSEPTGSATTLSMSSFPRFAQGQLCEPPCCLPDDGLMPNGPNGLNLGSARVLGGYWYSPSWVNTTPG